MKTQRTTRTQCAALKPPKHATLKGCNVPDWALKIVRRECTKPECTLFWIVSKSRFRASYCSGMAYSHGRGVRMFESYTHVHGPCIRISAGCKTSERYQLAVLLHEIAHINVGGEHDHDKVWQKEVVRLYRKHKLLEEVLEHRYYGYECERKAVQTALNRSVAKA